MNEIHLYLDDSGTRHPDRKMGRLPAHGCDYFSFGGILATPEEEEQSRALHREFCKAWEIRDPLHSSEIRSKSSNFKWIGTLPQTEQDRFYEELYCLLRDAPITGIACVIDRPGYDARYREKYGRRRWALCKTAFSIVLERAAKYAIAREARLRIWVEKSSKKDDFALREYYKELKSIGLPFNQKTSAEYDPLEAKTLNNSLYDLKFKEKSSPMIQFADLYTWPMCMGGYDSENRPYKRLLADKKLIDCYLSEEEKTKLGIKYSCFDLEET